MTQREKVIKRSAEMFVEYGVKSIRMDDIAHDLAMSKRTLYELFADKQELLYHAIKYHNQVESAEIAKQIDIEKEGVPALFKVMSMMLDRSDVRSRIMTNLKKFYPEVYERVSHENLTEGFHNLHKIIIRFIDKGLVSPVINVDLSVTMFYYTATGLFARAGKLELPKGVTEQHAFMYTMVNFFRGIATMEGIEQIDAYIAQHPYKQE